VPQNTSQQGNLIIQINVKKMKIFYTIPTSEEAKTFFNRYAGTIRTLKRLRTPAQLLSAITEFSVLYAVGYNSIEALNPAIAHYVGLLTGTLGTLLLEAVIRASTGKAIAEWLDQSASNNTLRFILSFVATLAIVSSGTLSWSGSKDIAQAIAADPELETTLEQDSLNQVALEDLNKAFSIDSSKIALRYADELEAKGSAFDAQIGAAKREKRNYQKKQSRSGNSYASRIDEARLKIETLEAEKKTALAAIKSQMNTELFELEAAFKADKEKQREAYNSELSGIEESNQSLLDESEANIKATGKSFGWITIVCLFFFVLITWCDEIVKHHSEQQEVALPGEFANRENSWLEIYKGFAAKSERWRRKVAANLTNHSHNDIELPYKTAFEVEQNYLLLQQALEVLQENEKRSIGFHKERETKEEFEEAEIIAKTRKDSTKHEKDPVCYKVPTKEVDPSLDLWQLKQRLKMYKKRVGKYQREITAIEKKKKPVPKRKLEALKNNKAWELSLINRINELENR
jgi:hypothetical protein